MRRITGRNVYITDLRHAIGGTAPGAFAERCSTARLKGIWVRLARGPNLDKNFAKGRISELRGALNDHDIELWGWHVPFCEDLNAATTEASRIVDWAERFELAGVLVDAERTPEYPRFRGGKPEAEAYMLGLRDGLVAAGRGIALSSHDQPQFHRGLPFSVFLKYVLDNCPQVYYGLTM